MPILPDFRHEDPGPSAVCFEANSSQYDILMVRLISSLLLVLVLLL